MLNMFKNLFGGGNGEALKQLVADGAVIIDVRTPGEFAGGHPKGAVNIPLDKLDANLNKIKAYKKPIIVCCASGMRSSSAKSQLTRKGIENVHDAGSWSNLR